MLLLKEKNQIQLWAGLAQRGEGGRDLAAVVGTVVEHMGWRQEVTGCIHA